MPSCWCRSRSSSWSCSLSVLLPTGRSRRGSPKSCSAVARLGALDGRLVRQVHQAAGAALAPDRDDDDVLAPVRQALRVLVRDRRRGRAIAVGQVHVEAHRVHGLLPGRKIARRDVVQDRVGDEHMGAALGLQDHAEDRALHRALEPHPRPIGRPLRPAAAPSWRCPSASSNHASTILAVPSPKRVARLAVVRSTPALPRCRAGDRRASPRASPRRPPPRRPRAAWRGRRTARRSRGRGSRTSPCGRHRLRRRNVSKHFCWKRGVADREHLVHEVHVGLGLDHRREAEPHLHAGGVVLQLQVDEPLELRELDDRGEPGQRLACAIARAAPRSRRRCRARSARD